MNALISRQDRITGGLLGMLIGDAVGVPYEFNRADALPAYDAIDLVPPVGFRRTHSIVQPGTWSDDGAQALCLLASLLDHDGFDAADFASRLLRWHDEGYLAVGGVVFDVGLTTSRALRALRSGAPPLLAGPNGERDNGNGSLMRVLPLALFHRGTDEELVRDAHDQSKLTHGHPRSQACCALYCLWARGILAGEEDAWINAVTKLRAMYADRDALLVELDLKIKPDDAPHGQGSGYVVDCLHSARLALEAKRYEDVVKSAIRLGDDTDTTACVAGGIAGLRNGVDDIPARWREALLGRDLYEPLLTRLLAR